MHFSLNCTAPSIPDVVADNPKGAATFFNIEVAGLINFNNDLIKIDPKAPPDTIIFFLFVLCLILYLFKCYYLLNFLT